MLFIYLDALYNYNIYFSFKKKQNDFSLPNINLHNKIVKPKDASSIIVLKRNKGKVMVLMGRRPLTAKFMPGVYVFPGGAVEKDDFKIGKYYNLTSKLSKSKDKASSTNHSIAIQLAAIRETAEETGLFLGKRQTIIEPAIFPKNNIWLPFYNQSLNPEIFKLIFLGRAITPSFMKIRFHARFYIAFFEDFVGNINSNGELEKLDWFNIREVKHLNVADVTEFMIDEIISAEENFENFLKNYKHPMFTWRNKKRWVKWEK